MNKIIFLIFIVVSPLFAVKEYYAISRSLRALGMGGAFYSVSNDEYALFYNPAGLSLYQGSPQGMVNFNGQLGSRTLDAFKTKSTLSGNSLSQSIDALTQYQGDPIYLGGSVLPYFLMKHLAVGILLADLKADYLLSGKELDSAVDFTAISDSGILVSYGRSIINENLHLGLTSKGLVRIGGRSSFTLADVIQGDKIKLNPNDLGGVGFGIDFDLGLMYDIPYLSFGQANRISFVLNNLLASQFSMGAKASGHPPGLVRTASLGWHTIFSGMDVVPQVHLLADLAEFQIGGEGNTELGARSGKILKHLNLGVEVPLGVLTLRTGIHQGYFTAGFGLNLTYAKLEFATYGEELSSGPGRLPSRRFALTLALGAGTPNTRFKPNLKGKRVDSNQKDTEFKIRPKPPEPPKPDPMLEIPPADPGTSLEVPLQKIEPKNIKQTESLNNKDNSTVPNDIIKPKDPKSSLDYLIKPKQ